MQTTFARVLSALALAPLALAMSIPADDMLKRDGCNGQLVTGHIKIPRNDGSGQYSYLSFGCNDIATCTPDLITLSAATYAVVFQSCIDVANPLNEIRTAPVNASDSNHYWPNTFWLAGTSATTIGVSGSSQTNHGTTRTNVFRIINPDLSVLFQWDTSSQLLFPDMVHNWGDMQSVNALNVANLGTYIIEPL